MEKMAWDGPKWGREDFFPTNPDLADILGRADSDFEDFFLVFGSQISGFPGSQISKIWPGPDGPSGDGWALRRALTWALGCSLVPKLSPGEWQQSDS